MKIDAHQHFWKFNEADYGWMNEDMAVIKKDHLPVDLEIELKKINFNGCVSVQARQTLEETNWLLQLSDSSPFIKGVVGWVDLCSENLNDQLDQFSAHPKFVGVRHVIHDEPDINFMLRPDFLNGISQLKKYNLTYDILVFPKHLPNTIKLVEKFPDQVFILDHIAKPLIREQLISPWKDDIEKLGKHSNIYCKLSGMVTEADWHNWKPSDFTPYLDCVVNTFGINRIMIGSDWPVCTVAGSYSKVMSLVMNYFASFSPLEQSLIFGGNAIKAYQLT